MVECQAEQGTFFYDGTKIFLNPNDGTIAGKEYNATRLGAGVDVSSNAEVIIADIVADFFQSLPMNIRDIQRIGAQNCEAGHGTATDGFTIDRTNGVLANCKAYKNRNDGFNLHGYGDTIIFHCDGFNNYDDGISHHDGCHGVIVGGNWYGNHKGGIIPTYGASVHVHGATCWGNNFGIYIGGAAYSKRRSVVVRDCKVFENNVGVLISTGYHADIDNVLAERNGTGISFVGDASGKVSRSIMADNIDNGCSLSTSKDVDLNDSKMTDNNRGINKTGTGHLGLKRNHVLYNEIAGISVIAGTVSIDKRNNLHGNVVDYEGGILTPEQKEMNVSFPSI